jgi:hypothetical protein
MKKITVAALSLMATFYSYADIDCNAKSFSEIINVKIMDTFISKTAYIYTNEPNQNFIKISIPVNVREAQDSVSFVNEEHRFYLTLRKDQEAQTSSSLIAADFRLEKIKTDLECIID